MACRLILKSKHDGTSIEVPVASVTVSNELKIDAYTRQNIIDSINKLRNTTDTLESQIMRVYNGPGKRLGCYKLNPTNKLIVTAGLAGTLAANILGYDETEREISIQQILDNSNLFLLFLDDNIVSVFAIGGDSINFLFKEDGRCVLMLGEDIAKEGVIPAEKQMDFLYLFLRNFKEENGSWVRDESTTITKIFDKIENLNITEQEKKNLIAFVYDHALEEDVKTKEAKSKGKKIIDKINKQGMISLFYADNFIDFNPQSDSIHQGDIIQVDTEEGIVQGVAVLTGVEDNFHIALFDNNGKMTGVAQIDANDNILIRKLIFDLNAASIKKLFNVSDRDQTFIKTDTRFSVGDVIYSGIPARILVGSVVGVSNDDLLILNKDNVLERRKKTDLVTAQPLTLRRGERRSLFRVKSKNIREGELYITKGGERKVFQRGDDNENVKYILRDSDNVDPKKLEVLNLFKMPLYDYGNATERELLLDAHSADPYFYIVNAINDERHIDKKKLFVQRRYDITDENGSHPNAIMFDTGGLYLKNGIAEPGDIIETLVDVNEVLPDLKEKHGSKVQAPLFQVVLSKNTDGFKLASFDPVNNCFIISSRKDLKGSTVYTKDATQKKIKTDELNLHDGLFKKVSATNAEQAAIACLQLAFGNIPVVFVTSKDEYKNNTVAAYTDLKTIYINRSYKGNEGKSITQRYAHELSHVLLAYLRMQKSETYFLLIDSIRKQNKDLGEELYENIEEFIVNTIEKSFADLGKSKDIVKQYKNALDVAFKLIFGETNGDVKVSNGLNFLKSLANKEASAGKSNFSRFVVEGRLQNDTQVQKKLMNELKYTCK